MNRAWLFTILGVCAAGLTAGFGIRPLLFPEARIAIYPSEIEFKEGHIQGESLETHFELKNESSRPITVTSVRASCGCMVVAGKNGSLTTPFTLENGAIFPVTLGVATGSRTGPNSFYLSVTAQGPYGTPAEANATVRVNLLAGLRTEPSAVIFRRVKTGAQLSAEVKLADMFPDPGVRVRELKLSNDKTMRVELEPESGRSDIFGASAAANARGKLKLSYVPDVAEGRIQEMITIIPEDPRFPQVQVPVYCEIAERAYRFTPGGLTIGPTAGTTFRRIVVFQSDEPETSLSVRQTPEGITVEIGKSQASRRLVTICGDLSVLKEGSHDVVFQVNREEQVFPIRFPPGI
jgi:hypothetical protein